MKDPYLKPVIFSGLFVTLLTTIFALGLPLWAGIGGYITVKLAYKLTKESVALMDSILLGLFSGAVGGTCIDLLTVLSLSSNDNRRYLISILKKNWPSDIQPIPDINQILPTLLLTTSVLILFMCILFSIIGAYFGNIVINKTINDNKKIDA